MPLTEDRGIRKPLDRTRKLEQQHSSTWLVERAFTATNFLKSPQDRLSPL